MPISPQITITPEDITYKSFDISAVTYTSSTATYTATGHTFAVGDVVMITGLAPDGYNGTYTITAKATNTFTVANTTNTALTDQSGNAYWADATEYGYEGGQGVAYVPDNNDVNSIIDVNATVAAAQASANAAAAAAGTAQSTANTALSNAATAYSAAVASLQPSASTIVNASNQMTAIATNGITVYSGSSSSSGARVVMNSVGLAGYDSSGSATFSITASTGAANFKGNITGSAITGSTLNISGKFIVDTNGLMTATDATITGTVNATAGYFGTSTNGFSINSTGMVGVGTGAIIGGVIATSSGSNAVILNGSASALQIKANGSVVSNMLNQSTSASIWHYGSTPDSSGATYPKAVLSSTSATIYGGSGAYFSADAAGNLIYGSTRVNNTITFSDTITANADLNLSSGSELRVPYAYSTTTANAATVWISSTGQLRRSTASSQRYKTDIVDLVSVAELDPKALYSLPVRAFRFKPEHLPLTDDRAGVLVPGFIAEEVDAIYPIAADYDNGVESWNDRFIVPALLALVQDLNSRLKAIEGGN